MAGQRLLTSLPFLPLNLMLRLLSTKDRMALSCTNKQIQGLLDQQPWERVELFIYSSLRFAQSLTDFTAWAERRHGSLCQLVISYDPREYPGSEKYHCGGPPPLLISDVQALDRLLSSLHGSPITDLELDLGACSPAGSELDCRALQLPQLRRLSLCLPARQLVGSLAHLLQLEEVFLSANLPAFALSSLLRIPVSVCEPSFGSPPVRLPAGTLSLRSLEIDGDLMHNDTYQLHLDALSQLVQLTRLTLEEIELSLIGECHEGPLWGLTRLTELRHLKLHGCGATEALNVPLVPSLTKLQLGGLDRNELSIRGMSAAKVSSTVPLCATVAITHLPLLEELTIGRLGKDAVVTIADLPMLKELILDSLADVPVAISNIPQVSHLIIHDCGALTSELLALGCEEGASQPSLHKLELRGSVSNFMSHIYPLLAAQTQLTRLSLDECHWGTFDCAYLASMHQLQELDIRLGHCGALRNMDALALLPLRQVCLELAFLERLPFLSQLRRLELAGSAPDELQEVHLAAFRRLQPPTVAFSSDGCDAVLRAKMEKELLAAAPGCCIKIDTSISFRFSGMHLY